MNFRMLCFLFVTQYIKGKSPDYIDEKARTILRGDDIEAWAGLDTLNQEYVLDYCNRWSVDIPVIIKETIKCK